MKHLITLDSKALEVLSSIGEWVKIFSQEEGAFISATDKLARSFNNMADGLNRLAEVIEDKHILKRIKKRFKDRENGQ